MTIGQQENPGLKTWEEVFSRPCALEITTLKAGHIRSSLSTILNLKNPDARGLTDKHVFLPVLSHLIRHPVIGSLLVDTGLDSSFARPGGSFKGILKAPYFKNRYFVEKGEGIDEQLAALGEDIRFLFLTHAHEHVSGVLALPDGITRMCGAGEKDFNLFPLIYTDYFKKRAFSALDFSRAADMPVFGRALDVFGDGSIWALPTPGHTAGHVSYLANAISGPELFTGDACASEKGLVLGIETGKSENAGLCRESFLKIKEFAAKYAQVKIAFGHECGEFKIQY
jgi:N-acyl homoserine lactone hydrolase